MRYKDPTSSGAMAFPCGSWTFLLSTASILPHISILSLWPASRGVCGFSRPIESGLHSLLVAHADVGSL